MQYSKQYVLVILSLFSISAMAQNSTKPKSKPRQKSDQIQPYKRQSPAIENSDEFSSNKTETKKSNAVRTYYFFQPGAKRSAITLTPYYSTYSTETGIGGFRFQTVKYTETVALLSYEFGLTSNHTVGLNLSFGSSELKYAYETNPPPEETEKESGLGDIVLLYKGLYPMKKMSLIYGLNFNYSGTKTSATSTVTGTRNSGGMSFAPMVGVQYKFTPGSVVGAKLNYLFKMERSMTSSATGANVAIKETGGSQYLLTAFYEKQFGKFFLTPYVGFGNAGDVTTTPAGGTAVATKGYTIIPFGFDSLYQMSKNLQLGIYYHGDNHGAYTSGTLEVLSFTQHQIGLFGRFLF
ncbi:MAG: hypothetical protein SGI74_00790 [Oligoflexia bacterium]|nr:hypothetical protein [Oligoflexia bacterium]